MKVVRLGDLNTHVYNGITGMTDEIRKVLAWTLHQILDDGVERGDNVPSDVWNELAGICNDLGLDIRKTSEESIKNVIKATTEKAVWDYAQRVRKLQDIIRPYMGRGSWGNP